MTNSRSVVLPTGSADSGKAFKKSATFSGLSAWIRMRIMYLIALTSVKACGSVMLCQKAYRKIYEYQEFFYRVQYDDIPRLPWRAPTSHEQWFLHKVWEAGNPEVYYRMLMVDVFEYGSFSKLHYLLERVIVGMHPASEYASIIFRLLTNDDDVREEGRSALIRMVKRKNGRFELYRYRFNLISKLQSINNDLMWSRFMVKPYCLIHPIPRMSRVSKCNCYNCLADFEVQCYCNVKYFSKVLNPMM